MANIRKAGSLSDKRTYFKQFFSVFTAIFLVMTVIILQVMNTGIYASVDRGLVAARDNINHHVQLQLSKDKTAQVIDVVVIDEDDWDEERDEDDENVFIKPLFKPENNLVANTDVILYDASGAILNQSPLVNHIDGLTLDTSNLGQIIQQPLLNNWGKRELYRLVTVRVNHLAYPEVAFATVLTNTDQLQASHERSVKIIVSVMVVFWIISLFASLYLAKWTRQPILENFERQKAFVENASHELRTPLAVLQNRLEGLFRKPDETILDHSESIAASLDEVRNMKRLTSNLLNLARRDDGLVPEVTNLSPQFFDDLFANYTLIAEEYGKAFTGTNLLAKPIQSDGTLLKQVLTILFDNAIKYTTTDGDIKISIGQRERQLHIEVTDNGPGISDQDKAKVFDRFYRVDKARTRQTGGFGLGLSLAQQIVTSLGGTITIKDNLPKGSTFEVVLPRS